MRDSAGRVAEQQLPKKMLYVCVLLSCVGLCDPTDCSPPGSSVYGILQARILEWVAKYWSELPFPSPGDPPDSGIEPGSPILQADPLTSEPPGKPPANEENFIIF